MILACFFSSGCAEDVANNQTNHQFTSIVVVRFMSSARVLWIIRRTVFNMYVCLNHNWRYEYSQSDRRDK